MASKWNYLPSEIWLHLFLYHDHSKSTMDYIMKANFFVISLGYRKGKGKSISRLNKTSYWSWLNRFPFSYWWKENRGANQWIFRACVRFKPLKICISTVRLGFWTLHRKIIGSMLNGHSTRIMIIAYLSCTYRYKFCRSLLVFVSP